MDVFLSVCGGARDRCDSSPRTRTTPWVGPSNGGNPDGAERIIGWRFALAKPRADIGPKNRTAGTKRLQKPGEASSLGVLQLSQAGDRRVSAAKRRVFSPRRCVTSRQAPGMARHADD
jgi:hypothetical protein